MLPRSASIGSDLLLTLNLRAPGSIGQASDPSRVWPGTKMPGRQGNKTTPVDNLEVVKVDSDNNSLFVKGAVPGGRNGIVVVTK